MMITLKLLATYCLWKIAFDDCHMPRCDWWWPLIVLVVVWL